MKILRKPLTWHFVVLAIYIFLEYAYQTEIWQQSNMIKWAEGYFFCMGIALGTALLFKLYTWIVKDFFETCKTIIEYHDKRREQKNNGHVE